MDFAAPPLRAIPLPELDPDAHVLVNLSGRGDKDLGILERELRAR